MTSFAVYYRFSTQRQSQGGLGLEAQEKAVAGYVTSRQYGFLGADGS